MRAVVDTNVWVSALIHPAGPPAQVLQACREGQFSLIICDPLLDELGNVLGRPRFQRRYPVAPEDAAELLRFLRATALIVPVTGEEHLCRDPKDDVVIETALLGGAEVIVSRDEDLTRSPELVEYLEAAGVRVLTVRRFLEAVSAER